MTSIYIITIIFLILILAVVLKGNRNLMDENRRQETMILNLRRRLRERR